MYSHAAYPPFNELLTGMLRSARVRRITCSGWVRR
jgi:hypothetical protein